jgi:hypothetical protein
MTRLMDEERSELEISFSPGMEGWLAREKVSLAFAVPPAKLRPAARRRRRPVGVGVDVHRAGRSILTERPPAG